MSETQIIDISEEMSMSNGKFYRTKYLEQGNNKIGRVDIDVVTDSRYYPDGYWDSEVVSIKGGTDFLTLSHSMSSTNNVKILYKFSKDGEEWSEYRELHSNGKIDESDIKMIKFRVSFNISSQTESYSNRQTYSNIRTFYENHDIETNIEQGIYSKKIVTKSIPTSNRGLVPNNFEELPFKKIGSNEYGDIYSAKINRDDFARIKGVF